MLITSKKQKKRILIFATKKPVLYLYTHIDTFIYILSFKDRRDDLKEEKQLAALYPINIFLSAQVKFNFTTATSLDES